LFAADNREALDHDRDLGWLSSRSPRALLEFAAMLFHVFGSVMRPSPYWPARHIAFGPFAAIRIGGGDGGVSYRRPLSS
jgi:hypothetical protein